MQKELNANEIEALTRALDSVIDKYNKNNKVIFANESERAKQHFGDVHRRLREWGKSRRCMVRGCKEKSIKRSHAIPKSMSLAEIAEGGHLVTPFFNQKIGTVQIQRIGLSDATTFPGFCDVHERLFEEFETKKRIDTEPQMGLQAYRAICREYFRAKFIVEQHDSTMKEYCEVRNRGLLRLVREAAKDQGVKGDIDYKSLTFAEDPLVSEANDRIKPVKDLVSHIENRLLPAIELAVFRGDETRVTTKVLRLDLKIPVALVGSAPFFVNDNGAKKKIILFLNVFPDVTDTFLIFGAVGADDKYVELYTAKWSRHALYLLSMIESWMINGTDQWYLTPSVWDAIPPARQSRLLSLLFSADKNIGDECDLSIFDKIRHELIEMAERANSENRTPEYISFIESERKKMT